MTIQEKQLYCCGCENQAKAFLVSGKEVYPHRPDLADLPFWQCSKCKNFVGCHYKSKSPTKPLGCIPTPELKKARQHIHKLIDPLWQSEKNYNLRGRIYRVMAEKLGKKEYHNGTLKSIEEAREAWKIAKQMPQLLEEQEKKWKEIEEKYLAIKPVEGKRYLVNFRDKWVEVTFRKREKHSCSLHGDPYLDYYFSDNVYFSIDGDLSLEKRTQELEKLIKILKSL